MSLRQYVLDSLSMCAFTFSTLHETYHDSVYNSVTNPGSLTTVLGADRHPSQQVYLRRT